MAVLRQHCLCSCTLCTCISQILADSWSFGGAAPDPGEEAADLLWHQAGRSAGLAMGVAMTVEGSEAAGLASGADSVDVEVSLSAANMTGLCQRASGNNVCASL